MKKTGYSFLAIGSAATLALLMTISIPQLGQEPAPQPVVTPVSACTTEDIAIPPPKPKPVLVGKETANVEPCNTPPTEIDFEPPKPNGVSEIQTPTDAPWDKTTPTPSTPKTTATVAATEPKMGDTRTIDGQNQIYILGFGWIDDNDEPNIGIVVDGDGDINKMVGTMD